MDVVANFELFQAPDEGLSVLRSSAILSSNSKGIEVVISNLNRVSSMDKPLISTNFFRDCEEVEDILKLKLVDSVSLPSTNTNRKDCRLVLSLHKP